LKYLVDFPERSLIVMRDQDVVFKAHQLGVGKNIKCQVGGKADELHGKPVFIDGKIKLLADGIFKHIGSYMTGKETKMGKSAVVEYKNVTIVITENRVPPFDINHIYSVGIRPEDYKVIVVKSAVAWKAAFG